MKKQKPILSFEFETKSTEYKRFDFITDERLLELGFIDGKLKDFKIGFIDDDIIKDQYTLIRLVTIDGLIDMDSIKVNFIHEVVDFMSNYAE